MNGPGQRSYSGPSSRTQKWLLVVCVTLSKSLLLTLNKHGLSFVSGKKNTLPILSEVSNVFLTSSLEGEHRISSLTATPSVGTSEPRHGEMNKPSLPPSALEFSQQISVKSCQGPDAAPRLSFRKPRRPPLHKQCLRKVTVIPNPAF